MNQGETYGANRMKETDILITGGAVYDGSGSRPIEADIGIEGGRISMIIIRKPGNGNSRLKHAKNHIDAKGLAVAPGFIDTHGHSEFNLLADSRAEGKVCQGITTEINGNCGLSAAPLFDAALKQRESDLEELGIRERWSTFNGYFSLLEKSGIAINFATLTGHGNIRASVIGYENRAPEDHELQRMQVCLKDTFTEGSSGISTGLIYPPGIYSATEELIALCRYLSDNYGKRFPGVYASHMRSEGDGLLEAIQEVIRIGDESGIRVHISHIKTSGKNNWNKIDSAISLIKEARNRGVQLTCDRYPYTAASTDLDSILPSWAFEGGNREELRRIADEGIRKEMEKDILRRHPDAEYWEGVFVSSVSSGKNQWMEGKSIAFIAGSEQCEPIEMFFRILLEEKIRVGAIFSSMSEDNLRIFLKLPYLMIGTDSSARSADGPTNKGKPHPRGFGSFPRFLGKYVVKERLMSMSEAIRRITLLPAQTFGIHERGIIREGAYADVVVFDPQRIIDRATFAEPFLFPEGISHVIVNGIPAVYEGKTTGKKAGKVLRNGQ
jgi:N-acyl-D-amino-acid deacylase